MACREGTVTETYLGVEENTKTAGYVEFPLLEKLVSGFHHSN